MRQVIEPSVKSREEAVTQIMVLQSEQIVQDGINRILRETAAFYADCNSDGGKRAALALQLTAEE